MKAYGATRWYIYGGFAEVRVPQQRSNRGRNRTRAEWWNRQAWDRPTTRESRIRRVLRKRERQQARAEIRYELHLWWLERELNTSPTRKLFKVSDYAYLKEIASESEIYELHELQIWYQHEMDSLLYDEDNRYSDSHGHVRYYDDQHYDDDDPELDDSDSSEPNVQDPAWRNAWVDGEVNTQYHAIWDREPDYSIIDDDSPYSEYDYYQWYRDRDRPDGLQAPSVHLDSDRNQERLRAGQRFYRQNKRTTSK